MHSKNPFIVPVVALFIVCAAANPQSAQSSIFYQNDSAQDQKSTTKDSQPASSQQSKQAAADLKPASTDEGQLATVNNAKIPAYAKVYVAPMLGGFENYIIAGLRNKKVPLIVVVDRAKADYEISGVSESEKAGWAKMLFMGSQNSNEQASIKVSDLKTGAVIFGYSVHKANSIRGRQSAGEACAKHIKQIVID
ncbi:MAG TPA: hypothetical protein VEV41_14485 [Terriglobales bacterium]|jgi:hypothetical protein|nr:hypothetical protein [Terriglobales bacterium]